MEVNKKVLTGSGDLNKKERWNERKTTMVLPSVHIMVLLHFRVGLRLYVIQTHVLQELEGP